MTSTSPPIPVSPERFEELVVEAAYDRDICRNLQIDYSQIGRTEMDRLRNYMERQYVAVEKVEVGK